MRKIVFILLTLFLLTLFFLSLSIHLTFENIHTPTPNISLGASFSSKYSEYLALDWKQTYLSILSELGIKNLRLTAYWEDLEKEEGKFSFEDVDFMVDQAEKFGAKVILVLGVKQPRWPECHIPPWAKNLDLDTRREKTLEFISRVVGRYKDRKVISAWQVENEPFLKSFGDECFPDEAFLKREIQAIKNKSSKPIIVTDSGELGNWVMPLRLADIFGTTIYRRVYNPLFGNVTYPLSPYFYNIKADIVKALLNQKAKRVIIIELQAEPWVHDRGLVEVSLEHQAQLFSLEAFRENIEYAKDTGFDEAYLWGVEWWYYMSQNGYPEYLEYAKTLFKN